MSQVQDNSLKRQTELLAENVNTDIYNQRKRLLGRVLTVLDATTTDPAQRKAVKDLIDEIFYSTSYWNDIRWHFQQFAKANGYTILSETETIIEPAGKAINIYEQV